jgi:type I restriction enzyme S subunit
VAHKEIVPEYLRYYLLASKDYAEQEASGTTFRELSGAAAGSLLFPIAPLNEQQRIVAKIDELFSELDAGVASLKRARALLKKYRQAVLKAAVTGELTRDWRARHEGEIRESGAELLQRILKARRAAWEAAELKKLRAKGKPPTDDRWKQKYKEPQPPDTTDLPALRDGWVWASLDQLSWDSCYGTSSKCDYSFGGVPVLRIPNVRGGYFSLEDLKNGSADLQIEARDLVAQGDMLIIRTNGSLDLLGLASVLTQKISIPAYFASYLIRFRLVEESILWRWVNVYWQNREIHRWLERNAATSAGQYNISQSKLSQAAIALPPLDEADGILESAEQSLSGADRLARDVEQAEKESSALRQAILKAAFAGRLVPQDPNDEPAGVLLARIRAERAARPRPARGRRGRSTEAGARHAGVSRDEGQADCASG